MKGIASFIKTLATIIVYGKGKVSVKCLNSNNGILKFKLITGDKAAPLLVGQNGKVIESIEHLATCVAKRKVSIQVVREV